MALQDFYGEYQVVSASGTEFGVQSTVQIDPRQNGLVPIQITSPGRVPQVFQGTYDNLADALRVPMPVTNEVMLISRFVDPTPGSTYRAVYGILIGNSPSSNTRTRLPVWSGDLVTVTQSPGGEADDQVSSQPIAQSGFVGNHYIWTTADAQFGVASVITITQQTNGYLALEITNALGASVMTTSLFYDSGTVSVFGSVSAAVSGPNGSELLPAVLASSVATENGTTYTYGILTVGDPEQAGTFGGEEGGP